MRKILTSIIVIGLAFLFKNPVYAGVPTPTPTISALSIRLEQPKTPAKTNVFDIVFVTLDLQGNPITVQCMKKAPGDAGFSQFGSDITLSAGGNTGVCSVDASIMSTSGFYDFKASAKTTNLTSESPVVTVSYNTEGPGDPREYGKSKSSACEYTIHFKTADDSGKTVKVEIYRSDATSFTANNGTRVQTVNISSNEVRDITDSIPSCGTTYYYAIRAFDAAGNGSNLVGDSETHVTINTNGGTTTTTTTTTDQGQTVIQAIQVNAGTANEPAAGGEVAGTTTQEGGSTLGESTPSSSTASQSGGILGLTKSFSKNPFILAGGILLLVGLGLLYVSRKKDRKNA